MKILTAHQPVYLPWLGLFHKISLADEFCFFDIAQYQTRDWNNRNYILCDGNKVLLTVPVLSKNHFDIKIKDVKINNQIDWRRKHWKSIYLAYKKTKYFHKYSDFFEDLYKREWRELSELNEYILKYLLKILDININFVKASDCNFEGYKSALVLDMSKKLEADTYIFGEQGENYADENMFAQNRIKIYFQNYQHPEYEQYNAKSFVSYLSVLDLLFNAGAESKNVILKNNISKEEIF